MSFGAGIFTYWIFTMFLYCFLLGTAAILDKACQRLDKLQYLLYAEHKRALLVVLQGLDAAGKIYTLDIARIFVFAANPVGTMDEAPLATITGSSTGLDGGNDCLAVDADDE